MLYSILYNFLSLLVLLVLYGTYLLAIPALKLFDLCQFRKLFKNKTTIQ